jgi:hypothetical protein
MDAYGNIETLKEEITKQISNDPGCYMHVTLSKKSILHQLMNREHRAILTNREKERMRIYNDWNESMDVPYDGPFPTLTVTPYNREEVELSLDIDI